MTIAPVIRSVRTKAPPARAFDVFTARMGAWWPKGMTPAGTAAHVEIIVEPFAGGRWFERDAAGVETPWGQVLVWEPPARLVLGWQLRRDKGFDPDLLTEVEITFAPAPDGGTEVTLEHRNLERFGVDGAHMAASVTRGWAMMLDAFSAFADADDTP